MFICFNVFYNEKEKKFNIDFEIDCIMNFENTAEDFVGIIQGNIDVECDAFLLKTPICCLYHDTTPYLIKFSRVNMHDI